MAIVSFVLDEIRALSARACSDKAAPTDMAQQVLTEEDFRLLVKCIVQRFPVSSSRSNSTIEAALLTRASASS